MCRPAHKGHRDHVCDEVSVDDPGRLVQLRLDGNVQVLEHLDQHSRYDGEIVGRNEYAKSDKG